MILFNMAIYTQRLNVQPVILIISMPMMVMHSKIVFAFITNLSTDTRQSPHLHSIIYGCPSPIFIGISFPAFSGFFGNLIGIVARPSLSPFLYPVGMFVFKLLHDHGYIITMLCAPLLIVLFFAFLAVRIHSVSSGFISRKFVDWLYLPALATSLFHFDLQNKTPFASWVEHDTKGKRYFNTNTPARPKHIDFLDYITVGELNGR